MCPPLVEVVRAEATSDETVETIYGLLTKVGKQPVVVQKEVPGFIANRLQIALAREALSLVQKGVARLHPDYVKRCEEACKQAKKVINELDELVETGFAGKEIAIVASIINELDGIEKDTDRMQMKIRAALLKIEKDLPPVDVIFYYKIIEGIGEVADIAQRIGSRVELLLAK
ncbi:MAG: DUF47 family protein [Proteobacteria bacterium]|nr:DUF47 family protein [Pseudomonadota bacterium]